MESLSFCITCKNRLWQLKQTLAKNLQDNQSLKSNIEFVLVDFASEDGLGDWVKENFKVELKEGYLKYYYTDRLPAWHVSVAKNTAHLYAKGSIVTNLDCDNFTGENGGKFVLDCFRKSKSPIVLHQFRADKFADGSFGRISVSKEMFSVVGGYDEQFHPMGFQDLDLLVRLWMMGVKYVHDKNALYNLAVQNTKEQSTANCKSALSYVQMNDANRMISCQKMRDSKTGIRNNGIFGIQNNVFDFENKPVDIPVKLEPDILKISKKYGLQQNDDIFLLKSIYGWRAEF